MEERNDKLELVDPLADPRFQKELTSALEVGSLTAFPPSLDVTEDQIPDLTRWL